MRIECENCGHIYEVSKQEPFFIDDDSIGVRCPKCDSWTDSSFFESYRIKTKKE